MKKIILVVVIAVAAYFGWQAYLQHQEEKQEREAEQQKQQEQQAKIDVATGLVRSTLKAPSSAQFQNIYLLTDGTVCGEVNARNSFGGYIGFSGFVVTSNGDVTVDSEDTDAGYQFIAKKLGCIQ